MVIVGLILLFLNKYMFDADPIQSNTKETILTVYDEIKSVIKFVFSPFFGISSCKIILLSLTRMNCKVVLQYFLKAGRRT